MHCLCPKSLKKEDIFFILQKPNCCKGFFGPDCRPCPGGFSKPCSGKGQVSRASSSIQLLWEGRISCVLKVPGAFLQNRNVGLHKGYPLHLCPVMAVNSRFSYRWEGKPICHLSDAQIADFYGSNTQHTGKAEWSILILLICTAQYNDPAHCSLIKTAKKGRI